MYLAAARSEWPAVDAFACDLETTMGPDRIEAFDYIRNAIATRGDGERHCSAAARRAAAVITASVAEFSDGHSSSTTNGWHSRCSVCRQYCAQPLPWQADDFLDCARTVDGRPTEASRHATHLPVHRPAINCGERSSG